MDWKLIGQMAGGIFAFMAALFAVMKVGIKLYTDKVAEVEKLRDQSIQKLIKDLEDKTKSLDSVLDRKLSGVGDKLESQNKAVHHIEKIIVELSAKLSAQTEHTSRLYSYVQEVLKQHQERMKDAEEDSEKLRSEIVQLGKDVVMIKSVFKRKP